MSEPSEPGGKRFVLNLDEKRLPEATEDTLTESDRTLIEGFDFKLNSDLTAIDAMLALLKKDPNNERVKGDLRLMKMYLLNRVETLIDTAGALKTSANEQLRALADPLETVYMQLASIVGTVEMALTDSAPDILEDAKSAFDVAKKNLQASSAAVKHNPAYRAYRDYVAQHKLEGARAGYSAYREQQQQP